VDFMFFVWRCVTSESERVRGAVSCVCWGGGGFFHTQIANEVCEYAGIGGKKAISKYMKLANPGMFH
jgi:hypothetical protein